MADTNESQGVGSEPTLAGPLPSASGLKGLLVLAAGVVLLATGGGYGAAMLLGGGEPASEEAAPAAHHASESPPKEKEKGEKSEKAENGKEGASTRLEEGAEFGYYEFEPIIVNLDEPRLARYVRVSITLVIKAENHGAAKALLDRRKPELKNWLTTYFASCTLDGARGAASLNRLRREILDAINQQLWPNHKPFVEQVLFKEFAVQ
ncbi:MAG: flagellar basal body-associated FliL family protein [Planctomycetota bacterium]|jgi:flagellar basal body-associated protein FliL|nr:flagellar basal body-associated FliL family protein [Planctomycetota bacterium]